MHLSQSFQINSKRHRAEIFQACYQRVLLSVQIITLLFPFTVVQKYVYPPVSKLHAGSLHVSIIHHTLTWTTGSLACVCDHSCTCVHTQGLGTPTASQHNFDPEKLTILFCAPDGIRTSVLWILSPIEPPRHPSHKTRGSFFSLCSYSKASTKKCSQGEGQRDLL